MSQLYDLFVANESEAEEICDFSARRSDGLNVPAFDQLKQLSLLSIFTKISQVHSQSEYRPKKVSISRESVKMSTSFPDDFPEELKARLNSDQPDLGDLLIENLNLLNPVLGEKLTADVGEVGRPSFSSMLKRIGELSKMQETYYSYFKRLSQHEDDSVFVTKFPEELVQELSDKTDAEISEITDKWIAREPSFSDYNWTKTDVENLLKKICLTCQRATAEQKKVLFRFSL